LQEKNEILPVLRTEIVGRYHYQKGKVRNFIRHDHEIKEADKILNDKELYSKVLEGTHPDALNKKKI
jgi:hypothetical protein